MRKEYYAGIDLHSNNLVIALVDKDGRRIKDKRLPCNMEKVLEFLKQYTNKINCIAVESTYNWYWLVDGLQDAGYDVVLANPAGNIQYEGLKHADDKTDAYFIAELLRLGILKCGYIYQRDKRSVRDLLRRRHFMVSKRTAMILSLKNQHTRIHGKDLPTKALKASNNQEIGALFSDRYESLSASMTCQLIEDLNTSIAKMEKACWSFAHKLPGYKQVRTLPGIGEVLGAMIVLETGDIKRFKTPERYASYCRTVAAKRKSNGKAKAVNNTKCGNPHLSWAYVEAANLARRYDDHARRWFDKKVAKTNRSTATKALACKLAKVTWHVMTHGSDYNASRLFNTT